MVQDRGHLRTLQDDSQALSRGATLKIQVFNSRSHNKRQSMQSLPLFLNVTEKKKREATPEY